MSICTRLSVSLPFFSQSACLFDSIRDTASLLLSVRALAPNPSTIARKRLSPSATSTNGLRALAYYRLTFLVPSFHL